MSRLVLALLLAVAIAGRGRAAEAVRVLAASSLTEVFRDAASEFTKAQPGRSVELSFAGSETLRAQIEQGAPADVFASADRIHADALKTSGLLKTYQVFARNALVVVAPEGGTVRRLRDLARPGVRIVVAGPTVPAGRYTSQVIAALDGSGRYGDAFQSRARANVASQETNVRIVLAKVTLGEADAGFVYRTDAAAAKDKVRVLAIPDRYNVVAEYPIAVLSTSAAPERAQAFVDFVTGPAGRALLQKYGFR